MTKMRRGGLVKLLLCVVLMLGVCALSFVIHTRRSSVDRTAPVITFSADKITYTPDGNTSALLTGVTATDTEDGDVTASLRVRGVSVSEEGTTAIVTYVARDQANNIGLEKRIVDVKSS